MHIHRMSTALAMDQGLDVYQGLGCEESPLALSDVFKDSIQLKEAKP